ncbi:MAG: LuxR C-terminal-related transcriptional regulator [Pseudomonadota bacterium]
MSDAVQDMILRIYDTIADQSLWPDVLSDISRDIDAFGCIVFEWTGTPRQLTTTAASSDHDMEILNGYIARCGADETRDQDIFERHSLEQDAIDLIDDSVLAPSVEALKKLPNVEKLLKFGIMHRAAGLLNKDNTQISRFSVQLGADRGPLQAAERAHLSVLLPHIAKALDLGIPARRIRKEHQSLIAAMDRLLIGLCILDHRGYVVQENAEFRRQRETYNAFFVNASGKLAMSGAQDQARLASLTAHARNHGHFGARPRKEAIATNNDGFLCLDVAPLHRSAEIGSKAFNGTLLYSTDTSLPTRCNTTPMKRAYMLTDTEFDLLDQIAKGLTNGQIAEERERSVATVNVQVKSILSKTQCMTRTQLVRLMMSFGTDFLRSSAA